MKPLHVSKLRAAVRLSQPHRDPRDGWFLLFPDFDESGRAETVLELLNSPRLVIPFIQNEDEGVRLLVRDNIDWVAIGAVARARGVRPKPASTVTFSLTTSSCAMRLVMSG